MVYSLTDKLTFEENPKIEIKGRELEVNAEAETALKLFDLLDSEGEVKATMKAFELLFSKKDREYIKSLKLSMTDYRKLLDVAMDLCVGNDPDEEQKSE